MNIARRNVLWLGIVSFFTDVSSEMIFPIIPLFLTRVLGAPLGAVGLIEGIAQATANLLKGPSGWLTDRLAKQKALIITGYGLSTLAKPLFALTASWPQALLVRFADRAGKGIRDAPRDALIALSVGRAARGIWFGLHRALDSTGAIVGSALAALLLSAALNYRTIFWLSAIPALIALALLWLVVRERRPRAHAHPHLPGIRFGRPYWRFISAAAALNLASFSYALYLLRASELGLALISIPLVYLLYNIFYTVFSGPAGRLSDVVGRRPVLAAGYFVLIGINSGFGLAQSAALAWLLMAAYGLHMAIVDGTSRAYVSDIVPERRRATALGLYHTTVSISAFAASTAGGLIWQLAGAGLAFSAAAVLALVGFILLVLPFGRRAGHTVSPRALARG